jgi:hypothetical protein
MNKSDLETKNMGDQMRSVQEKINVGCTVFGNRITSKLAYEESGWRLCAPQ